MEPELAVLSDGQATDSSGDDSFDEGPTTYHEWRAFVLKTYLNGVDPRLHQSTKYIPSNDYKAKEVRKAIQPPPNTHRIDDNNKRFKVPVKDASGNPIVNLQSTPNPFAKSTTSIPPNTTTTITTTSTSSHHQHQHHHHHNNNNNHPNNIKINNGTNNPHFAAVTSSNHNNRPNRGPIPTSKPSPNSRSLDSRVTKSSSHQENIKPVGKPAPVTQLKIRSDVFWSLNSAAKLLHVKGQLDEPSKIYVDKLVKSNGIAQREIQKLRKEKQDLSNAMKMVERIISDPQLPHNQPDQQIV